MILFTLNMREGRRERGEGGIKVMVQCGSPKLDRLRVLVYFILVLKEEILYNLF